MTPRRRTGGDTESEMEAAFRSLPGTERTAIVRLGAAARLSYKKKRLSLAESKLQELEVRYGVTLAQLDAEGLPDDAGHAMHEDYVMWHHWADVIDQVRPAIAALEGLLQQALSLEDARMVDSAMPAPLSQPGSAVPD